MSDINFYRIWFYLQAGLSTQANPIYLDYPGDITYASSRFSVYLKTTKKDFGILLFRENFSQQAPQRPPEKVSPRESSQSVHQSHVFFLFAMFMIVHHFWHVLAIYKNKMKNEKMWTLFPAGLFLEY